ncbi:hypothetical protein PV325_013865 [Microctonus aethiopoides]|nr:hypothetical protein PV325_013865 [Microctonus aethiopoides]KAK0098026.1 hypothetical protein PV326_011699 [Microctonus aethiopoides]
MAWATSTPHNYNSSIVVYFRRVVNSRMEVGCVTYFYGKKETQPHVEDLRSGHTIYLASINMASLMHDDMLYESEDVKEALRRLPTKILDERNFRLVRALQLSCQKIVLPQEQWTKFEEDVRYLEPYLEQVRKEIKEKEEWDKE